MSGFNVVEYRQQFETALNSIGQRQRAQRVSVIEPLVEELRAQIPATLYAARDEAREALRLAQEDVRAAEARVQTLQVAQVSREQVPQLVRDRALAAGELVEYRRLVQDAEAHLARCEAAITGAAREIWQRRQSELIAAFEEARRISNSEVARLEEEHRRAVADAERPARDAAEQVQAWQLLAEELGVGHGHYVPRLEHVTPQTKLPGSQAA